MNTRTHRVVAAAVLTATVLAITGLGAGSAHAKTANARATWRIEARAQKYARYDTKLSFESIMPPDHPHFGPEITKAVVKDTTKLQSFDMFAEGDKGGLMIGYLTIDGWDRHTTYRVTANLNVDDEETSIRGFRIEATGKDVVPPWFKWTGNTLVLDGV